MSNSDLRRAWKAQQAKKQDVTNAIPALMGNGHGVIEVPNQPGYVYIRLSDTDLGKAFNNRCPLADNLAIYVGYDPVLDPDRRIFQVLSVRMADYAGAGNDNIYVNVPYHHLTHEFGGGDDVYIEWRRLMGLRVGRPSGFEVTVDDGVLLRAGAWMEVASQTLDLSAFQPAGLLSCYVLISLNAAGVAIATAGADVAGVLDISDCPVPGAGEIPLAAVKLYGTQTAIGDTPSNADIVDLRYPASASAGVVHLEDLDGYARGHIIRGGAADWESYHAANAGFIVQGDGLDVLSAAFDWDTFSAGVGADMVHNHASDAEGGALNLGIIEYSEDNVSNPPTWDDIISAFGLPSEGLLGIINDNADESHVYLCGATITGWWYVNLAKTAMLAAAMLSVITTDTMTDGAGTHLNVHTPDVGGAWTENSGSWTIQAGGDVRQATAAGAYYIATQDAGKADFQARTLIGTVDAAGVTFGGVIFRYSDASNFWIAAINNDAAPIVALRKVVAGVPTDVDTKSWVSKHQVWVAIEVTCDGNDITVIVDGGFTLSTTDAFNNTATKVGIGEYRNVTYKAHGFDDFQIVDLPAYPWTRTGTVVDETEAWESGGTLEPNVIYDTDPQILAGDYVWKMWYSGSWAHPEGVGYAESLDGIAWTKYAGNPIATAPRHCHVMKVGNTYYMYGSDDTVSRTRVNLWTSPDGLTWTLDTTACISVGAGAAWDSKILGNTFVWRESSTAWYMLYDATDTLVAGIGMTFRTGLATSTDGRTWVKSPANPVIDYSGQEAGSPWLMKADDGYYYLFGLGSTYGFAPTAIWRWRSLNLTTWERLPYFTIIPRAGATEGEDTYDGQTADPFIVEHDGVAYLYFTGVQDAYTGGSRIVLATADARAIRGY